MGGNYLNIGAHLMQRLTENLCTCCNGACHLNVQWLDHLAEHLRNLVQPLIYDLLYVSLEAVGERLFEAVAAHDLKIILRVLVHGLSHAVPVWILRVALLTPDTD